MRNTSDCYLLTIELDPALLTRELPRQIKNHVLASIQEWGLPLDVVVSPWKAGEPGEVRINAYPPVDADDARGLALAVVDEALSILEDAAEEAVEELCQLTETK